MFILTHSFMFFFHVFGQILFKRCILFKSKVSEKQTQNSVSIESQKKNIYIEQEKKFYLLCNLAEIYLSSVATWWIQVWREGAM